MPLEWAAIYAGNVVTHHQSWVKPNRGARGVTLQGVIWFFIHMGEEHRKTRLPQVEQPAHGGGAVRVGRNVMAATLVRLVHRSKFPSIPQLREHYDGRLWVFGQHPLEFPQEVPRHWITIIVEAQHNFSSRKAKHSVPGIKVAHRLLVLQNLESRKLAPEHSERVIQATVSTNHHLIRSRPEPHQLRTSSFQVGAPIARRNHDSEGHDPKDCSAATKRCRYCSIS